VVFPRGRVRSSELIVSGGLGNTDFGVIRLDCRSPVLIPRPETAYVFTRLAELIVRRLNGARGGKVLGGGRIKVVDLYTGSGAIGLLLHRLLSEAGVEVDVLGVDINPLAVDLARENARRLRSRGVGFEVMDVMDRGFVEALRGRGNKDAKERLDDEERVDDENDTEHLKDRDVKERLDEPPFHMILANPPYIPFDEYTRLPRSVKEYEDVDALLGDGVRGQALEEREKGDGLGHYRRLAEVVGGGGLAGAGRLRGWDALGLPRIAVEIGDGQGERVQGILEGTEGVPGAPLHHPRRLRLSTEIWKDEWDRQRMVVGWRRK
jgi:release factor glutamine methyltransferase